MACRWAWNMIAARVDNWMALGEGFDAVAHKLN